MLLSTKALAILDCCGVKSEFEQRNAAFFANPAETNKLLKLFWIGSRNNDRTVMDGPRKLSELLKRRGITHEFHETEGGHAAFVDGKILPAQPKPGRSGRR